MSATSRPPLFPAQDELEGLLPGPGSITWRRASDTRLYVAMLYPLLLQVAHPTVGAGVRDFSDFEARPWNRLVRTIDYVSLLVYGGPEAAAAGRRLRAMHKGFRGVREDGKRYYALEPDAYAWVHATLLETYVAGHAQFGTPLNPDQRERFYREYRDLGRLIGVRERDLPADWRGFRAYFDEHCQQLQRTESVDRVLRSVSCAARPPLPIPDPLWRAARLPAARMLYLAGVGLMAPALRDRLDIPFTSREQLAYHALGRLSRSLTPLMPSRLRVAGPDQLRLRGRAIAAGPLGPAATSSPPVPPRPLAA
ncbi:MAG: oxygenase MpaB family protein [Solirubrobacteraceae bacterium]